MESFDRTQAEYLVYTYSDMILRLSYTYLKSTHDAEDICSDGLSQIPDRRAEIQRPRARKGMDYPHSCQRLQGRAQERLAHANVQHGSLCRGCSTRNAG